MDRRLTLIKDMMQPCEAVADIGTDHGFLVCALVESGIAQRGVAADINPLPLAKARQEIAARGLCGKIETRCADGLGGITLKSGDSVIIAGMGGELIARILADWPERANSQIVCYLQPMTRAEHLRDYLYTAGFVLCAERCCVAAGRPYSVMEARGGGLPVEPTALQRWLGGIDPSAGEAEAAYCRKLAGRLHKKLLGLPAHSAAAKELQGVLERLEKEIGL